MDKSKNKVNKKHFNKRWEKKILCMHSAPRVFLKSIHKCFYRFAQRIDWKNHINERFYFYPDGFKSTKSWGVNASSLENPSTSMNLFICCIFCSIRFYGIILKAKIKFYEKCLVSDVKGVRCIIYFLYILIYEKDSYVSSVSPRGD